MTHQAMLGQVTGAVRPPPGAVGGALRNRRTRMRPRPGKCALRFSRAPVTRDGSSGVGLLTLPAPAWVVCILLLGGVGLGYSHPTASPPRPIQESSPTSAVSDAASALSQAERSLADGTGPAMGLPMSCQLGSDGGTCSTSPHIGVRAATLPMTGSSPPPSPHRPTPPARFGAAMALFENATNAATSRMGVLLFGGANSSGTVFRDTWQFNTLNLT